MSEKIVQLNEEIVTVKPGGGLLECSWCEKISP